MLHIDRERHLLKETDVVRFLRRELREPDLVTLWSQDTETWVLGHWVNR